MLRPTFESLDSPDCRALLVRSFGPEAFGAPYHFHPELELTLILSGAGKRFVGKRMEDFSSGDLVLIGSGLPHCWKTAPGRAADAAIVIQFAPDCLGQAFFRRAGLGPAADLLSVAGAGISFTGRVRDRAESDIRQLADTADPAARLTGLVRILDMLSRDRASRLLDPEGASPAAEDPQNRFALVLAYVSAHYTEQVSLREAASIAGLSENAFCKYFKKITRKTFLETVTEYRLGHAARLLAETDLPVSAVCFKSGFGDISHFNKTFKAKMLARPLDYRRQFARLAAPGH